MTGSDRVESKVGHIRAARGLSVAALASKVGLSRQALYAIEGGTYVPNTAVSLRLASALETSVEDLFRIEAAGSATETVELIGESVERGAALQICTVGDRRVGIRSSPMPAY